METDVPCLTHGATLGPYKPISFLLGAPPTLAFRFLRQQPVNSKEKLWHLPAHVEDGKA